MKSYEEARDEELVKIYGEHGYKTGYQLGRAASDFGKSFSDKQHEAEIKLLKECNTEHNSKEEEIANLENKLDAFLSEKHLFKPVFEKLLAQNSIIAKMEEALNKINGRAIFHDDQSAIEYDCMNYSREALIALKEFREENK